MHYRKWVGSEFVNHASGIAKHEIPQVGKWNEPWGKASVHHQMVYATKFSAPDHVNEPIDNWNMCHIVINTTEQSLALAFGAEPLAISRGKTERLLNQDVAPFTQTFQRNLNVILRWSQDVYYV